MKRRIHIDRKMPDKAKISGYQNFDHEDDLLGKNSGEKSPGK